MSNIKRKFGNVSVVRCFESFANGYPHIHALVLFNDSEFEVFEHMSNDIMKGSTYRIQNKKDFESWHSHVDVLAVNNMGHALRYITKYLRKSHNQDDSKYNQTQSLLWVNNKQSYSISKDFKQKLLSYRLVFVEDVFRINATSGFNASFSFRVRLFII